MQSMASFAAVAALCLCALAGCIAKSDEAKKTDAPPVVSASVAQFTEGGALAVPADLDKWIFLGSSLGMGYSQQSFDPNSPGMFQIVQMEPGAYAAFMRDGEFPDGAMFLLSFYESANQISINRSGFVMGEAMSYEIHLKDKARFPETGFNFYTFGPGDASAPEVPLPNSCVECHTRDGAHDGVFTQFYPGPRDRLAAKPQ